MSSNKELPWDKMKNNSPEQLTYECRLYDHSFSILIPRLLYPIHTSKWIKNRLWRSHCMLLYLYRAIKHSSEQITIPSIIHEKNNKKSIAAQFESEQIRIDRQLKMEKANS